MQGFHAIAGEREKAKDHKAPIGRACSIGLKYPQNRTDRQQLRFSEQADGNSQRGYPEGLGLLNLNIGYYLCKVTCRESRDDHHPSWAEYDLGRGLQRVAYLHYPMRGSIWRPHGHQHGLTFHSYSPQDKTAEWALDINVSSRSISAPEKPRQLHILLQQKITLAVAPPYSPDGKHADRPVWP